MNSQKRAAKKRALQKMELLGSTSIPKALLAMGIPTMIGMLVNAFYNLVDAYFVGGLGESQMGQSPWSIHSDRSLSVLVCCSETVRLLTFPDC